MITATLDARGRSQRRYEAPPGYRACIAPDCAAGPCGMRNVLPENLFPKHGKYRSGMCPVCRNAYDNQRMKARYRANPGPVIARAKESYERTKAKRRDERVWRGHMAQRLILQLRADGWQQKAIAHALHSSPDTIRPWERGTAVPREDKFLALFNLVQELMR